MASWVEIPITAAWDLARTASKFEWLRERPDKRLATPEGQAFLDTLEGSFLSDKTDSLMPWVVREWKKGRIRTNERGALTMDAGGDRGATWLTPGKLDHMADWFHSGNRNPTRRGIDVMQLNTATMHDKLDEWDAWMQEQAEKADQEKAGGGEVVHHYPNGWSLRKLGPEHLGFEGKSMANCVGDYGYEDQVRNNERQIYSLRDHNHQPHATMEIEPVRDKSPAGFEHVLNTHPTLRHAPDEMKNEYRKINNDPEAAQIDAEYSPDIDRALTEYRSIPDSYFPMRQDLRGGTIHQIQGKGNEIPKPEYQAMLKQYFETIPENERPSWHNGDEIDHVGQIFDPEGHEDQGMGGYGPHGDYGLADTRRTNYDQVLDSLVRYRAHQRQEGYEPAEVRDVYEHARDRREIPQLHRALEGYAEHANEGLDALRDRNYDLAPWPGESPEEFAEWGGDPEDWESAKYQYDETERQLREIHPPSQVVDRMFEHLKPHWEPTPNGNPWEGQYTNAARTFH